jgi:DDE family transposase
MKQYDTMRIDEQEIREEDRQGAQRLVQHLDAFLTPLLEVLDAYLDRRLVRTFRDLVVSLIQLRHREVGVLLSELGAVLLNPKSAPAGSKRLSNLLHSPKWASWIVDQFLFRLAEHQLQQLEEKGETALVLHDGSELEKPESVHVEGLCPVRSSKGRRLSRPRPKVKCVSPTAGQPIIVPGIHWHGAILIGLASLPRVVKMHYWTSRGERGSHGRREEERVVGQLARAWGSRVIHVFDRGWAGGPWLAVMQKWRLRFVERWTSRYELLDEQGKERKAWEIARGKKESVQGQLWWAKFGREIFLTVKVRHVRHASLPQVPLYLVIASAKEWDAPWYLLTNEPIERVEEALRIVQIYARRWQIEWSFRFEKGELGIEHIRVRDWEAHLKFLAAITIVYAFLLSLLELESVFVRSWLLQRWDHQTGKRARQAVVPLYRLRRALSRLWALYQPQSSHRGSWWSSDPPSFFTSNTCSQSSG